MTDIKLIAIGGQDERGKNLFALEINDEIFILDAGVKYPDKGILGVDVVIPKLDYLKDNVKKIKGIFLTNPASYNSGAVGYLLKVIDVPIYCNEITHLVSQIKLERLRVKGKENNFKIVKDKDKFKLGNVEIEIFRTTASSPQSLAYAFKTEHGAIIYAGDYIIDGKEQSYFSTDFNHISEISKKGILALIADAEFASRMDFTVPNHKIDKYIATPFKEKKTRIAIGIFEEDIYKLGEIVRAAKENNRKIAVYGRTMTQILKSNLIAEDIVIEENDIITAEQYMQSNNGVLIISGTGDVLYSKLTKIATGNDNVIEFSENDLIIIATPPAAGIEKRHAQTLDELARTDAKLIALSDRNIWSMHASYEDVKMLVSITNPKYFIPVKALYKDFLKAEQAAIEAGVSERNIVLLNNGEILKINEKNISIANSKVDTGNIFVDGITANDIGSVVLYERKQLANDGAVIIGITLDARNKEIISLIDTQMRGVIFISGDNPIFKILQKEIETILEIEKENFRTNPKSYDISEVKKAIAAKVKTLIKQATGKQPIILVMINEVGEKAYVPNVRPSKNIEQFGQNKNQRNNRNKNS